MDGSQSEIDSACTKAITFLSDIVYVAVTSVKMSTISCSIHQSLTLTREKTSQLGHGKEKSIQVFF